MKPTEIIRTVDSLGRIVLPSTFRKALNIDYNDFLAIYTHNNQIILEKSESDVSSVAIIRQIDPVGRIVLPSQIREKFKVKLNGGKLLIFVKDKKLVMKKYDEKCVLCSKTNNLISYNDNFVCKKCIISLNNLIK